MLLMMLLHYHDSLTNSVRLTPRFDSQVCRYQIQCFEAPSLVPIIFLHEVQ